MVGGKLSSVRHSVLVQGPLRGVALGAVRQSVDSNGHQFSLNSMSSVGALGGAGTGSSIVPSSPSTALSTDHCARHMRVPSRLHTRHPLISRHQPNSFLLLLRRQTRRGGKHSPLRRPSLSRPT